VSTRGRIASSHSPSHALEQSTTRASRQRGRRATQGPWADADGRAGGAGEADVLIPADLEAERGRMPELSWWEMGSGVASASWATMFCQR